MTRNKRYDNLNGLRAMGAVSVLMMHVLMNGSFRIPFPFYNVLAMGGKYVSLFMMVSAFSMCCGYYEKFTGKRMDLENFYHRRIMRIWPFFALLCVIDVVLSPGIDSLYELFANLTLCFGLLPNPNISVIGVGWFLGIIFVFYMIFPFFCYLISDRRRAWMALFISIVFHYICKFYFFDINHVPAGFEDRGNMVSSAMFFIGGGLIFIYRREITAVMSRIRYVFLVITLVLFGVLVWKEYAWLALIVYGCMTMYAIGDFKGAILDNQVTAIISDYSLEIYLCHMIFYRIFEKLHLIHLLGDGVIGYVVTCAAVFMGAWAFALVYKQFMKRVLRG